MSKVINKMVPLTIEISGDMARKLQKQCRSRGLVFPRDLPVLIKEVCAPFAEKKSAKKAVKKVARKPVKKASVKKTRR